MAFGGVLLSRRHHTPHRTCVGCRVVEPQRALVRVGFVGPHLVIGKVAGRGAYVHPRQACIEQALRGGFTRSFRRSIQPEEIRNFAKNATGLDGAKAVETPSRISTEEE